MAQQKIFRQRYVDDLLSKVKADEGIDLFRNREFQISDENVLIMPHISNPHSLLTSLNANDDFKSAISVYEAYKELTTLEASDPRFWNYLSLVDLYSYVVERWPKVYKRKEETNDKTYILEHFIIQNSSQLLRHWLSGLWWSVHLTIDVSDQEDKYKLTKVLFWNQTLRTRTMGTYLLARKKEIALGFLDYCHERDKENFGNFEKEHQELTEYLNILGGAKSLAFYSRQEIMNFLLEKFPIPIPS